jgi:hypothetical protein
VTTASTSREPRPLDPTRDLWDQQGGESEQAFAAFTRYRVQGRGERTFDLVGEELGKSTTIISRWSSMWSWRPRVIAWDRTEDIRLIETHWEEIDRMSKRHAGQAAMSGQIAMAPAMAIFKLIQERPDAFFEYFQAVDPNDPERTIIDFDRLDRVVAMAMTAARLLPGVHAMERVARGMPAEVKDEAADPRAAADQYLIGDPVKRRKAQELFAIVHGTTMPALPPGVVGEDGDT